MLLVAAAAVALAPIAYFQHRSAGFRRLAAFHASQSAGYTFGSNQFHLTVCDRDGNLVVDRHRARQVFWHGVLRDKYERAALRPWEPVEPDEPDDVTAVVIESSP
jgi:hypothetical protein